MVCVNIIGPEWIIELHRQLHFHNCLVSKSGKALLIANAVTKLFIKGVFFQQLDRAPSISDVKSWMDGVITQQAVAYDMELTAVNSMCAHTQISHSLKKQRKEYATEKSLY